tara:strand:- start:276 stop:971 length:696 start_codon:yes stop_codon:yes gene_type:complete
MTTSILDMALNYELEGKKYYLTLAGKRLKTKKGNEIFTDSLVIVQATQEDYKESKFKSKWINLVSSYVDFLATEEDIKGAKDQLVSYLKNDLLLYLESESNEYFEYQNKTYLPLLDKFKKLVGYEQGLVATSGFNKVNFEDDTLNAVNEYVEKLSNSDLFTSLFLTRISTSSVLTILYLAKELSIDDFYSLAFYAEVEKLAKASDDEEEQRLQIIKHELNIINYFSRDGLE